MVHSTQLNALPSSFLSLKDRKSDWILRSWLVLYLRNSSWVWEFGSVDEEEGKGAKVTPACSTITNRAAAAAAQWSSCVHNLLKGENNSCSSYEVLTLEFSPCVNDDTVYSSQQIAVLFGFFIPKWRSHCSPSEFALSSLSLWSGQNREENTRSPRQEKSSTKMTCARGFLGWQWYLSICQKSGATYNHQSHSFVQNAHFSISLFCSRLFTQALFSLSAIQCLVAIFKTALWKLLYVLHTRLSMLH